MLATSLREHSPVAHAFLKELLIPTEDQQTFLRRTEGNASAMRDEACRWVLDNEHSGAKWKRWLPELDRGLPTACEEVRLPLISHELP